MTTHLGSEHELDSITRKRMQEEDRNLLFLSWILGMLIGFIFGMITTSLLHKYVVHPFGY